MDNAREVSPVRSEENKSLDLVEQTKAYFLRSILEDFKEQQLKYDLNEEFVKTKRNRSFVVFLTVLAVIVAFGSFAFLMNNYIEHVNNTISIASAEFDDISLRDLLASAKNIEGKLTQAKTDLASLQSSRDLDLQKAKADADQQSVMLRSKNPSADELAKRQEQINKQLDSAEASINKVYQESSKKALYDIGTLESQLAAFDPKKLELAKQQEVLVNNERQLYDLERDKLAKSYEDRIKDLTDNYEARISKQESFIQQLEVSFNDTLKRELEKLTNLYNPSYAEAANLRLLTQPIDAERPAKLFVVPRDYVRENLVTQEDVATMNQSLTDYNELVALLKKIPYQGSIPQIIEQLQSRTFGSVDGAAKPYGKFWQTILDLRSNVSTLKKQLEDVSAQNKDLAPRAKAGDQLTVAMEQYAQKMGIDSFVIDGRDPDNLVLYVSNNISFTAKQRALIVRLEAPPGSLSGQNAGVSYPQGQTKVTIAEIEIVEPGEITTAKAIDKSFGKDILPYDQVVPKQ